MAVLTALFAAMVSMGLGLSLALLGNAETALAAHDRDARALRYASRAAAALAISELHALPSVSDLGNEGTSPGLSATPGGFVDSTLTPRAPWGNGTLDLRALTARIQAESDAAVPGGAGGPTWRLFVYGDMTRLAADSAGGVPAYLVAWVANDRGVVLVRAAAFGPEDARALTELSLKTGEGSSAGAALRLLAVRPDP